MASTGESGRWRQVAGVLLAEVDRLSDPAVKAAKLLEIGDVFRQHLGDGATAAQHYAESVRLAPALGQTALSRLAALAREVGDLKIMTHFVAALSFAERWVDVVTVLVKQAEVMPDAGERAGLFLEAAELTRSRLGDPALAREYLLAAAADAGPGQHEAVAEQLTLHVVESPDDAQATVALARLEALTGRPQEAVAALTRGAAHVRDLKTKAAMLLDASTLCGDRAAQPVEAAVHAYEALVLDPELAEPVDARLDATRIRWGHVPEVAATLEQIYERIGRPDRVQEVMYGRLSAAPERERPSLLLRMAEHAEYQLLDPGRAFVLYRQGLEEQGGEPAAFAVGMRRVGAEGVVGAAEAMIELFGKFGLWRALVNVHDGEAAVAVDDAVRAEHIFLAGEALESRLDDLEGAMQHYLQAFKLRPREARYLAAGERVYRRREEWPMADRLLGLQIRVTDDPAARARLLVEQGRVRFRCLEDARGAYESVRAALADGGGESALSLLGELVQDEGAFGHISASLRERAAGEGGSEAARILTELAALLIELRGATHEGLTLLGEASELAPEDEGLYVRVTERLELDTSPAGRDALATWLAGAGQRPFSVAMRVAGLRRAAALLGAHPDRRNDARELLRQAATLAPQDADVCHELLQAARQAEDPLPLAAVLARMAAGMMAPLPDLDRDGALRELAAVYEDRLGDLNAAADCHRTLLADRPADPVSLPWMRDQLSRREAWEELRACLEAAADACAADGQDEMLHELWVDLADLSERKLTDLRLAAIYVRKLWEATRNADARDALHRLYGAAGDRDGELGLLALELAETEGPPAIALAQRLQAFADEEPRSPMHVEAAVRRLVALQPDDVEAVDDLISLLRSSGRALELLDVLALRAERTPGEDALPFLRERAVLLTEDGDDLAVAAASWETLLSRKPDDDEGLRYLQGIHEAAQDAEAAAAVMQRRIDVAATPEVRVSLLRELAVRAELRLGEVPRAAACWEAISALLPEDTEAIDERLRLYEMDERWDAFLPLANQRIHTLEPAEAAELSRQVARLAEAEGSEEAVASWERVQAYAPDDAEAAQSLTGLCGAAGDRSGLARNLGILALHAQGVRELRPLRERQARAYEAAGDLAGALEAYRAINQLLPQDRGILTEMRRLAGLRHDDWTLCRVLETELVLVPAGAERIGLEKALARRLDQGLGEQANATAVWERILAAQPKDPETLEALKLLYADLNRPKDLVRVLRVLLDLAVDDDERITRLCEAAKLIEIHRRDPAEAFECWWRAFKLSGEAAPEMLREMGRLAEAAGLWDRYIKVLELARERAMTRDEQVEVLVQQSRVAEERLRSPDKARELLKKAYEMAPREGRVLDEYTRICESSGAFNELLDAYALLMKGTLERESRAALLVRSAGLMERHLKEPDRAFETFAQALRSGASDAAVLPELVRLAAAHGFWDDLTEIYRDRWQKQSKLPARLATLHELARVLETKGGDWERAFEQYLIALQLDPEDEATRAEAWRLAAAHGAWDFIIRVFELKAKEAEETWLKITLLHDVAGIQERKLAQPEKAMETLRRAFAIETWNETTHAAMRRLAGEMGRWRELALAFEEEAGWAAEPHARLRLYREAATLLDENGDRPGAARILRHVVDLEPTDEMASTSLSRLLREELDWAALAQHLESRLNRGLEDARVAVMQELIGVYRDGLCDERKAAQMCQRILGMRPADPAAHEALAGLLEARRDWPALAECLEARARVLPVDQRGPVLRRRASVLRDRLENPRDAFRVLARLAQDAPDDVALVLELAGMAQGPSEFEEILVCAERSMPHAEGERLSRLLRVAGATARDQFQNRKKARAFLARALELEPSDRVLAAEVLDLAQGERRFAEVVALLERYGPELVRLPDQDEGQATAAWALRLAEIQADRLGDLAASLATLEQAHRAYPTDLPLLSQLRATAARAQATGPLLQAITAQVRAAQMPVSKLNLLMTGARELEALNAAELAIGLWQQVLELDPTDETAVLAVHDYAARRRDWDLLASQLRSRLQATVSPTERGVLLCELAVLHRDRRADEDAAYTHFQEALEADPRSLEATEGLAALALSRADVDAVESLAKRLMQRLDHRPPPLPGVTMDAVVERATPLLVDLHLFRARRALAASDDEGALEILRDAWRRSQARDEVGHLLADVLYREAELSEAATIYARLSSLPPAPDGLDAGIHKAQEMMRRGRAFAAARDEERALRAFEAAAQEPITRIEALEALANLQERAGHWEASIRVREKLIGVCEDPRLRALTALAAGIVAENRLNKPARAVAFYDRALAEGLADRIILQRLFTFYREQQRAEQALVLAERLVEDEADSNLRAELLCAIGEFQLKAGSHLLAREAFDQAHNLSPLLLPAARGLLDTFHAGDPEYPDAAEDAAHRDTLKRIWQGASGLSGREKLPVLELLGQALMARDDVPGALEVFEEVHAAAPEHLDAQRHLASLYGRLAQQGAADPSERRHFERAIRHRLSYLRAVPAEPEALRELVTLYRGAGHPHWAVTPLRLLNLMRQATREETELSRTLGGPLDDRAGMVLDRTTRLDLVAEPEWKTPAALFLRALWDLIQEPLDVLLSGQTDEVAPAEDTNPRLVEQVWALCDALELPRYRVWIRQSEERRIESMQLAPVELVLDAGLLAGTNPRDLQFILARAIELTRGSNLLRSALGPDDGRALFAAAMAIALGEEGAEYAIRTGADSERIGFWADFLVENVDHDALDGLASYAGPVAVQGPRAFEGWSQATERMANRVAFVLSGDFARAVGQIQREDEALRNLRINGPEGFRALMEQGPAVADVYRFAFGQRFHALLDALR